MKNKRVFLYFNLYNINYNTEIRWIQRFAGIVIGLFIGKYFDTLSPSQNVGIPEGLSSPQRGPSPSCDDGLPVRPSPHWLTVATCLATPGGSLSLNTISLYHFNPKMPMSHYMVISCNMLRPIQKFRYNFTIS